MKQVAYVSEATVSFTDADIRELMQHSRRKNKGREITGMLLYDAPLFLQIVEGPAERVDALLATIASDPRHTNFAVVYQDEDLQEREFARWRMGCKILGDRLATDFAELDERVKQILRRSRGVDGELARELLLDFRRVEADYVDV